jgi:ketosteroid isomerase-like protein
MAIRGRAAAAQVAMVSTPDSAPAPVAKLLDAANAHDTEAFLDTFVDAAVVDDWGREFVGTEAIRTWSDREFIGKHVTLKIGAIRLQGELTVVTAQVGGEGFNGRSHFSFLIDGDLVSRMTIRA